MRGRSYLLLALLMALSSLAVAHDLGPARSPKPAVRHVAPPPDPEVIRQGGDTIADAVPIDPVDTTMSGTTVGYTDDYDEVCPYTLSVAPDVVYLLEPTGGITVDIDMCGSDYDTKIYVYDQTLELVACNDDFYDDSFCGQYVSRIPELALASGESYYLVIDGYYDAAGTYELRVSEIYIDGVDCPSSGVPEGEPELVNDYVDEYNGGCTSSDAPGGPPFQDLAVPVFCGRSGWYQVGEYSTYRDTDWFTLTLPATGVLEITGDAQYPTYLFELGPQDCATVDVLQQVEVGPFVQHTLTIQGEPGSEVWFWVGPTIFDAPDLPLEYLYVLWTPEVVAVEQHSWTAVKGLFD
jgi:hypothetical protein